MPDDRDRRVRQLFALLRTANIADRDERLTLFGIILHRPVQTTSELSEIEVRAIIDVLDYWKRDDLPARCQAALTEAKPPTDNSPPLCDADGHQLIQVEFMHHGAAFTYAWAGDEELKIGDKVRTAPLAVATVCALGSHYNGPITVLTDRASQ